MMATWSVLVTLLRRNMPLLTELGWGFGGAGSINMALLTELSDYSNLVNGPAEKGLSDWGGCLACRWSWSVGKGTTGTRREQGGGRGNSEGRSPKAERWPKSEGRYPKRPRERKVKGSVWLRW